jgi:hypothetical protein
MDRGKTGIGSPTPEASEYPTLKQAETQSWLLAALWVFLISQMESITPVQGQYCIQHECWHWADTRSSNCGHHYYLQYFCQLRGSRAGWPWKPEGRSPGLKPWSCLLLLT